MNGISQINIPVTVEVNYDPGVYVGMTVYDDSGSSPVMIGSVIPMLNVVDTLYRAQFTPTTAKSYIFRKAVYTDGTYTTIDPNFSRASESIQALDIAGVVLNAPLIQYLESGSAGAALAQAAQQPPNFIAVMKPTPAIFIQGSKPNAMIVKLIDPNTLDPMNLTGVYDILASFLNLDGSITTLSLQTSGITLQSAPLGKIAIQPTAAQTTLMQTVQLATLQVSVIFSSGADPSSTQIPNAYSVIPPQPNP